MAIVKNGDGSLSYDVWYVNGGVMINRECLEAEHPEHLYNYLKSNGYCPEDYGIYDSRIELYQDLVSMSKEKLISEVIRLRKELDGMYKTGF